METQNTPHTAEENHLITNKEKLNIHDNSFSNIHRMRITAQDTRATFLSKLEQCLSENENRIHEPSDGNLHKPEEISKILVTHLEKYQTILNKISSEFVNSVEKA